MLEIGVAFGEKLSSKIEEHVRLYKLLGRLASLALHHLAKHTPLRFAATPTVAQPGARTTGPTETMLPKISSCPTSQNSPPRLRLQFARTPQLASCGPLPASLRRCASQPPSAMGRRQIEHGPDWVGSGGNSSEIGPTQADVSPKAPVRPTCGRSFAHEKIAARNERINGKH